MIDNMNKLKRQENSRIRKIGDEYYIVSGKDCFQVNEIAALIVNAIGKDLSISDMCSKLSAMYKNNDIETIREDVTRFIDFIVDNGIANICETEGALDG